MTLGNTLVCEGCGFFNFVSADVELEHVHVCFSVGKRVVCLFTDVGRFHRKGAARLINVNIHTHKHTHHNYM